MPGETNADGIVSARSESYRDANASKPEQPAKGNPRTTTTKVQFPYDSTKEHVAAEPSANNSPADAKHPAVGSPANGPGATRPRLLALCGHFSNKDVTQLQLDNLKFNHETTDIVFMDGLIEVRLILLPHFRCLPQ